MQAEAAAAAVVAFAATNLDDLAVLVVLFARAAADRVAPRKLSLHVAAGQLLGFSVLVALSLLGLVLGAFVPAKYVSLLGFVPILIGLWKGASLVRETACCARRWPACALEPDDDDDDEIAEVVGVEAAEEEEEKGEKEVAAAATPVASAAAPLAEQGSPLAPPSSGTDSATPAAEAAAPLASTSSSPLPSPPPATEATSLAADVDRGVGASEAVLVTVAAPEAVGTGTDDDHRHSVTGAGKDDALASTAPPPAAISLIDAPSSPTTTTTVADGAPPPPPRKRSAAVTLLLRVLGGCCAPLTIECAVLTVANGADNIAIYLPMFAAASGTTVAGTLAIFYGMLCCMMAAVYAFVRFRPVARLLQQYGTYLVPPLLVGLGIFILHSSVVFGQ